VSAPDVTTEELQTAIDAVRSAMRVCRRVAASSTAVRKLTKSDRSPVTVADFATQAIVVDALRRRLGPSTIVGEESAEALRGPEYATVRGAVVEATRMVWSAATEHDVLEAIDAGHSSGAGTSSYWTLDPIDGTKGFLRGGQYAVSLAKIVHGEVVLGLLGCPALGLALTRPLTDPDPVGTLHVGHGGSTRVFPGDTGESTPVSCAPHVRPTTVVVTHSVESGHTKKDDIARILEHLGWSWHSLPADSQAKYALVARGQAHAYLRVPGDPDRLEPVWDHAAGVAVARGAGAVVTDLLGRPLDFSQGDVLRANHGIICAHPTLHAALVRATAELGLTQVET
jgi:HAL2 family 3'(2'),5'-bisphosphate nucleotidase